MINNPIIFTQDQLELIETIKSKSNFCSQTWGCEEVEIIKPLIRKHYSLEQNATCPYCQMELKTSRGRSWDVEHIIPRAAMDSFMFEPLNLCVACVECNSAKSHKKVTNSVAKIRYPTKGYFIIHPHFDHYHEHITVIRVGLFYFPRTAKGEKTIYTCELNRFYSYASFDDTLDDLDDLIFHLSTALCSTDNEKTKIAMRAQIRELTLRQALVG